MLVPTRYESVGCDDGNFSFPKEFQISQRSPPNFNEVKVENLSTSRFSYNKPIRTPFGEMNQRAASSTPLLFPCLWPLPFYFFAIIVTFSKIFKGLKIFFHFGEKFFSTKRKFNLDRPKLQYLPIGTRVLTAKYWTLA